MIGFCFLAPLHLSTGESPATRSHPRTYSCLLLLLLLLLLCRVIGALMLLPSPAWQKVIEELQEDLDRAKAGKAPLKRGDDDKPTKKQPPEA